MWQASLDPILGPPEPYDMMSDLRVGETVDFVSSLTTFDNQILHAFARSMNFVAGNCRVLWKVLEAR